MKEVLVSTVRSMWGKDEYDFSFMGADGLSGGMLSIWNSKTVKAIFSFRGKGFLGNKVSWKGDGEWIIGGDFNAVKKRNERVGRSYGRSNVEWRDFSKFIEESGLVDVPCKGKKFSWFSGDGKSKCRLDRFLVEESLVSSMGVVGQMIGSRDISDHCTVWLISDKEDWGPKPFKFNNEWFSDKNFMSFVEKEWRGLEVFGRGNCVLKEKFRLLKDKLRWWNKTVFGRYEMEVEEGVREFNASDDRESWDDEEIEAKKMASKKIWVNLKIKENMLIQKARLRWMNDGDNNIKFFHRTMKERNWNHIGSINSNGGLVSSVAEVKEAVKVHFEDKFKEDCLNRPKLDGVHVSSLSWEDSCSLETPFLEAEIREAVWSCDGTKSPGPDGFSFLFHYEMLLLAGRIKKILSSIISDCQSAFTPGRHLIDGVVVANELVDYASKKGKDCLLFKFDFEKAYDKVSWNFLRYMMRRMGFGARWIKWMEALVFSSKMSVLVNGSRTREFGVEGGLRQGDPISPFLFVIAAEGLKCLINKAVENGDYAGCNVNGKCFIDILQFADDTLLVGDGSWNYLWAIKSVLKGLELVSGLGINYHKSKIIGININSHFLDVASSFLSCSKEAKEFKFLGIRIGSNPRRLSSWKPLLDSFRRKLSSWKGRFLSFGGRITLLKSVLSSLSIFTLSFYKAPKKIIGEINKLQSKFLWGGVEEKRKIHWISWKEVCKPLEKGGLGLRSLEEFNIALLMKWRWRILNASNSLWYRILKARYVDVKVKVLVGDLNLKSRATRSVWWSDIMSLGKNLPKDYFDINIKFVVGCGYSFPFWHANWLEVGILKHVFPVLFDASLLQDVAISSIGGWALGDWIWGDVGVKNGADSEVAAALPTLFQLLPAAVPGGAQPDLPKWLPANDGNFTVSSCFREISKITCPFGPVNRFDFIYSKVWKVEVPLKVKAFAWRCFKNKIPTRNLLLKRGVPLDSSNLVCVFCEDSNESSKHLLLECKMAEAVWQNMALWLGMTYEKPGEFMESFWFWSSFCHTKKVRRGKEGSIWLAIVWSL
ncbi:uncharacterized protein LOC131605606 [Vicia villosa]|uniref:uncharacterized protein LOC131605606 n=1 Tax=Vicia villosa TaxID=3911 RepID=UPI00273C94A3|nr:uncharacterized protein LOC131605606 [Vicia villosa]